MATGSVRDVRARALARLRDAPAWAWLCALVAFSIVVRYLFSRRTVAPWIFSDELVYSELAKSFAATGHFAIRDEAQTGSYGIVYPLLISPAYALFDAVPQAYAAAKTINAAVMSLAAIPAFFLARRVLRPRMSLLAALLTVAVPSMVYVAVLMTESAYYPVFLACVLVLVLVLERPTAMRQLLLVAVLAFACATRVQALALVATALTAPLLLLVFERSSWRSLRAYRVLYGLLGAAVALPLAAQLVRGRSLFDLLGAYGAAGDRNYELGDVAHWLLYHLAELDLYLGVAPLVACVLLLSGIRSASRPLKTFMAATLATALWTWLQVSTFAAGNIDRIEERNLFYVAPLFFICLLAWIELGAPRPRRLTAAAALAFGLLPAVLPLRDLIGVQIQSDTLMLIPWWYLNDTLIHPFGWLVFVATLAALAVALTSALLPRRLILVLPAFLLVYYAASFRVIENWKHGVHMASIGALMEGIGNHDRDWIDRKLGSDAQVAVLWSLPPSYSKVLAENEFFNRSVGTVYNLSGQAGSLPETAVTLDARGLVRGPDGSPIESRYVLAEEARRIAGRPIAFDRNKGMAVYKTSGPLRLRERFFALDGDHWTRPRARYVRYRCSGGTLRLELASDPQLFTRPQIVSARSDARLVARIRVAPNAERVRWLLPLQPRAGICTLSFAVSPTAVPARVVAGSTDNRRLGVRVLSYTYQPPGRAR